MRKFFHSIRNIVAHFLSNNTAAAPLPNIITHWVNLTTTCSSVSFVLVIAKTEVICFSFNLLRQTYFQTFGLKNHLLI